MFNHQEIEKKWQKHWEENKVYKTGESKDKPKYYILDMFPYPSGAGLHVGHPKGYIATDVFARMKTLQGFNVLHPMGFDSFGLPAENYAIKTKTHPKIATQKNVNTYKAQLEKLGFSYDWDREIDTIDPKFYKWTQWAFLKMFERGLAFESHEPIIWCPSCMTNLAQEDLEDGKCERCGSEIEKKPLRQWVLRITDYADRMLNDLDKLDKWESSMKEMQKHWIGKSTGASVDFRIKNKELRIKVFTTRPDTLFGATYMVLAPEHEMVQEMKNEIENWSEAEEYIKKAQAKGDLERGELNKDKTGVELKGVKAINPVNQKEIPVYIADYVLMGYGTGAIMAVPAHDERDFEFAKKYNIDIIEVVTPCHSERSLSDIEESRDSQKTINCFSDEGKNINSEFLDGLETKEAKEKMISWLRENKLGKEDVNYKINDWVFARQRYWGEPFPLVHCEACKEKIEKANIKLPEKRNYTKEEKLEIDDMSFYLGEIMNPGWIGDNKLPVELPEVESYEPSGTGESPLATIEEFVNTKCPKCGGPATRETNTMPQWAGSSWYYLRYIDPQNDEALVDKDKEEYWSPVDFYVGGAEHATRHLIYARFWHKFLFDIGAVKYDEPFTRLQHVGLIMAEDGRKMSKRWGNVINPDDIVEGHGADTMRIYEMFMGPFSQAVAWNTNGLLGARRFLEKVWMLKDKISEEQDEDKTISLLHKTIKKVGEDIQDFKFNTAVAQMMILANEITEKGKISKENYKKFLIIISPFTPHLAEELWQEIGETTSILKQKWPEYDKSLIKDKTFNLVVQVNGKLRDTIEAETDIEEEAAKDTALNSEVIKKWIEGKEIVKVIYVKGKLVNIVVG